MTGTTAMLSRELSCNDPRARVILHSISVHYVNKAEIFRFTALYFPLVWAKMKA